MGTKPTGEQASRIWGKLGDIQRQVYLQQDGYPHDLEVLDRALQDIVEGKFGNGKVVGDTTADINWHAVYEKLGLLKDLEQFLATDVTGETCADQNTWMVPVLKGVTPNKVVKALRDLGVKFELFGQDLDRDVPTNDRDPNNGSYSIRFKKNVEADPENANQSANDRKAAHAKDITLLERLLLELGYFLATGQHLDVQNVTLCAGSRYSDGRVPGVYWGSGGREVYVDWFSVDYRDPYLRSRAAVS